MKKVISAISFAICSFACSAAATPPKVIEADLRAAATSLKDPDSAKFKDIRLTPSDSAGTWNVCGQINSKNSYGGYGGFQPFIGLAFTSGRKKPDYAFIAFGDTAGQMCEKYAATNGIASKNPQPAPVDWPAVPASVIEQK